MLIRTEHTHIMMMTNIFKLLRNADGLSVTELAQKLNISPSYISEIESGNKRVSMQLAERYSEVFGISLSTLFYLSDETKSSSYRTSLLKVLETLCK